MDIFFKEELEDKCKDNRAVTHSDVPTGPALPSVSITRRELICLLRTKRKEGSEVRKPRERLSLPFACCIKLSATRINDADRIASSKEEEAK